jgi:tetratricopeptide (TPR) repeat protein
MMEPSAIGQAWQRLNRGDAAAVATELADLSASAPEPAILLRGLAYFDAGDSAKAAADFEAVLARDPQNPVAASHLALAKFKTGDALGAANIFDAHPLFPQFGFLERFLHLFWPLRATTDIAAATYGEDKKPALSADFARFEAHADRVSKRQKKKLAKALMNECSKDFFNRHYVSARTLAQRALAVIPDGEDYIITNCAFAMLDGRTQDALELSEPLFQIVVGELTKDPSLSGNVPADVIMIRAAAMHALGKHEEALRLDLDRGADGAGRLGLALLRSDGVARARQSRECARRDANRARSVLPRHLGKSRSAVPAQDALMAPHPRSRRIRARSVRARVHLRCTRRDAI